MYTKYIENKNAGIPKTNKIKEISKPKTEAVPKINIKLNAKTTRF